MPSEFLEIGSTESFINVFSNIASLRTISFPDLSDIQPISGNAAAIFSLYDDALDRKDKQRMATKAFQKMLNTIIEEEF